MINSLNICLSSSLKLGIILSSKYYIVVILSSSGISSLFNLRQAKLLFLLVFSLYYICIEFILLFYNLLVISFARSTEYSKRQVSQSKFSDGPPEFTWASVIRNFWITWVGLNILISFPWAGFNGDTLLFKSLRNNSQSWQRAFILSKICSFLCLSALNLGLAVLINSKHFSNRLLCFY